MPTTVLLLLGGVLIYTLLVLDDSLKSKLTKDLWLGAK